ncbi:MAG: hypothetical protein LBV10_14490 [Stenotrophomonas sp.]|uniref:hypothetical protein n=1 Tax=Stenotrophomonas sp. TaxID=69392 RepID=UPI0028447F17|nr:hypothetical protein [Stenotrophomonas sp.]MDR2960746.1 hypothetical protein [Stenotrophomonas sp.]
MRQAIASPRLTSLPMHTDHAPGSPPQTSTTRPAGSPQCRQSAPSTIVIADANPWVRRELAISLRPHLRAETLIEARSPAEVLAPIANPHCTALVIDPCMPTIGQTDGLPLLRQICCLRNDLLILVLAHQPLRLLQDRRLPTQIRHVYAKTVNPRWLCRFISQALPRASPGTTSTMPGDAR